MITKSTQPSCFARIPAITRTSAILTLTYFMAIDPAFAARRVIQFAGNLSHFKSQHLQGSALCTVTLVNTGDTRQKISSFTFHHFSGQGTSAILTKNSAPAVTLYRSSGTPASCNTAPSCASEELDPGATYVASIPYLGQHELNGALTTLCAGRFTAEDSDPSQAGSMVASGSIAYVTESKTLGGQFHGALYANQINRACYKKCMDSGKDPQEWCSILCGRAEKIGESSSSTGGFTEFGTTSTYPALSKRHMTVTGYIEEPMESKLKYVIKIPDPSWNGGLIQEMVLGSPDQLCSGGTTSSSSSSWWINQPAVVPTSTPTPSATEPYPHGLLNCFHTDNRPLPYSSITPGTSFAINGGMPF